MNNRTGLDNPKRIVEPFNLFGKNTLIFSKEEAAKVLKDNSYYVFVAAAILLAMFIFLNLESMDIGIPRSLILFSSIFYFTLGFCIRIFKSRVASILALISFGYVLLSRLLENDIGGTFGFTLVFTLASYRAVKASFFYHRKSK